MVSNLSYAQKMQYRSKHQHNPTKITDIFDGAHYRSLLETHVTIDDEELPMWFFSDPRDIALGLSTDGFGPFKKRNKTAWPLIIFNYNLPPKERFRKENIISLGTIPGRSLPCPCDSYRNPVIPADSGGFRRNKIWQRVLPNLQFRWPIIPAELSHSGFETGMFHRNGQERNPVTGKYAC